MPSNSNQSKPSCIHKYLCEGCVALRDVDQETPDTEAALQQIRERRQAVLELRNQKHDRVTQLVPPEIASHIFLMHIESESYGRLRALFKLARVCKSWRDIALSAPQLWTDIRFVSWGQQWSFSHNIAQEWFRRSKSLPIHVTLDWRYQDDSGRMGSAKLSSDLVDTFNLLQRYTHRIKCLEIRIPEEFLTFQIFQGIKPVPKIDLCVSRLPRNRNIFRQVAFLHISATLEVDDALDVLRQCPLLFKWEGLTIQQSTGNLAVQNLPISVHLQELEIQVDQLSEFFDAVTMPALRRMHLTVARIHYPDAPDTIDLSSLAKMLNRSATKLDDFALDYGYSLGDDQAIILLDMLRSQCDLRKLSVKFTSYRQSDPTALLLQPFLEHELPRKSFLPFLKHFYYSFYPISSWAPIAAFYKYHSAVGPTRSLSVADFSSCDIRYGEPPIDEESLRTFLTLPMSNISLKLSSALLASSIRAHKMLTPTHNVLFYSGLSKIFASSEARGRPRSTPAVSEFYFLARERAASEISTHSGLSLQSNLNM